jgi:hypothetical protein
MDTISAANAKRLFKDDRSTEILLQKPRRLMNGGSAGDKAINVTGYNVVVNPDRNDCSEALPIA